MISPSPTGAGVADDLSRWRDTLLRSAASVLDAPFAGLTLLRGASWSLVRTPLPVHVRTRLVQVCDVWASRIISDGAPRFLTVPGDSKEYPGAYSFAGVPIRDGAGTAWGALWVATPEPRDWTGEQRESLGHFGEAFSEEFGADARGAAEIKSTRRQQETHFRALFETAPFGILVGDLRVQRFETNPAWQRIFWWWEGSPFEDVVRYTHPDDLRSDERLFQELLTGARDYYRIEKRYVTPDGGILWGEITLTLLRDEAGSPAWLYTLIEDISDRKRLEESLARASTIDELTGLANRRGFLVYAERELRLARRRGEDLLVVYIDLDGFKVVNDTFGHAEGDSLLRDVGDLVEACFRATDVCARIQDGPGAVARVGGDEFVVLAPGARDGAESVILERLSAVVDEYNAATARPYELSLSIGIARHHAGASDLSVDALLARADHLMYEHKRRHRSE